MENITILQGRLVADPELRQTQSGIPVASFTVAWSETYNEKETQLFLDCSAWRGLGEMISKHFYKGKEILVRGRLETQKWQDKDGNNRSTIKMTVDKAHFCGPKNPDSGGFNSPEPSGGFTELPASDPNSDGELPF